MRFFVLDVFFFIKKIVWIILHLFHLNNLGTSNQTKWK